jgi:hypothetical protein
MELDEGPLLPRQRVGVQSSQLGGDDVRRLHAAHQLLDLEAAVRPGARLEFRYGRMARYPVALAEREAQIARIRLLRGLSSTSARPTALNTGGT